jgi:amylosucrase
MLFYGDELGYINDYSFEKDPALHYDNRWMHRPIMHWERNALRTEPGTIQESIFSATQKLIQLRKSLPMLRDESNIQWAGAHNRHIAGFARTLNGKSVYCFFNFSDKDAWLTWYALRELGCAAQMVTDLWEGKEYAVGGDDEYLVVEGYGFVVMGAG